MILVLWFGSAPVFYSSFVIETRNVLSPVPAPYLQDICSFVWCPRSVHCQHSWCWCCYRCILCYQKLAWGCHLLCVSRHDTWHWWQQRSSRHHNQLVCPLPWWHEQGLAHRRIDLKRRCGPVIIQMVSQLNPSLIQSCTAEVSSLGGH